MTSGPAENLLEMTRKVKALVAGAMKANPKGPKAQVWLEKALKSHDAPSSMVEMEAARVVAGPDPREPWASQLWDFQAQISACMRCELGKTRRNFVFGEGDKNADLMFVGEAPGRDEDGMGRPFVGKAGQLLDRIIQAMGFNRQQVFIANLIKCRPPQNRDPLPEEIDTCRPFVEHQIELIKPKIIVALGRFAAQTLLRTGTGITKLHGRWTEHRGIPVMPTFHPAAILRDERMKRPVWEDMKLVMKKLNELQGQ